MNKRIEELKAELKAELRKECNNETVLVVLELNSYGFNTTYEERSSDSLKSEGISMKNIRGEWIK
jgi:hypothetical protein